MGISADLANRQSVTIASGSTTVIPISAQGPPGPAGADGSNVLPTDTAIAAALADTGSDTYATAAAAFAINGRQSAVVYDDFTAQANGAISGRTPVKGSAWVTSGAQPSVVSSGAATSTGTGYMSQTLAEIPRLTWCDVKFTATGQTMTMASCVNSGGTQLDSMVHFNFGPSTFLVSVRRDAEIVGGAFDSLPGMSAGWKIPVASDGSETARFQMYLRGNTVTVIGPDGVRHSATDPRIGSLSGPNVLWEPNVGAKMTACGSIADTAAGEPGVLDMFLDDAAPQVLGNNSVTVGNRGGYGETSIGIDGTSGLPSITLGAAKVYTSLASAATIGATSITTLDKIPNGSTLRIESGNALESKTTTSGSSGTGPYTESINSALTANHAAGVSVVATSTAQVKIAYNPENGATAVSAGLDLGGNLSKSGTQLVSSRNTGWTMPTGSDRKGGWDAATVTLQQLAEHVKTLTGAMHGQNGGHGLIGN